MSAVVVVRFTEPSALREAARQLAKEGFVLVDAFTPFPVDLAVVGDAGDARAARRIGWAAALAGLGVGASTYGLEWFSAALAYPFNSGGRPLNAWPVFLLAPFELGVLAAAIGGLAAFLWQNGLPRLNHPAFEIPDIERASRDRFFLAIAAPETDDRRLALAQLVQQGDVWEGEL